MIWYRSHQIFSVASLALVLLVYSAGVTLSADTDSLPLRIEPTRSVTLVMESYSFTPNMLTAELGKPIEFILKNESFLVPHNFLLDSPDGVRLVEANVDSGEEARVRFTPTHPGVYTFYCDKQLLFFPNHREEGMEGTLTVH